MRFSENCFFNSQSQSKKDWWIALLAVPPKWRETQSITGPLASCLMGLDTVIPDHGHSYLDLGDGLSSLAPGNLPCGLSCTDPSPLFLPSSPTPPPHPSPPPPLPFTRASRPKKAHSRGIFTKWEHPEGKDLPTWLHVWLSGTSSLYFFHGDSSRDHQRQPAWGRCHCSSQALIRVMQPCADLCLEVSALSPCHLSPKFREGECIAPGFTLAWNTLP